MARTWTARTPEEKDARVKALLETIAEGAAAITSGEDWKRMLVTASRFHTYSFRNVLLIRSQRPDARRVAGFRTWKAMGRQVRKGEKGIAILAPTERRFEAEDPVTGEVEVRRMLTGFRIVHVFDIEQTDGEPIPTEQDLVTTLDGEAKAAEEAFGRLRRHAGGGLGLRVELRALPGSLNGYLDGTAREIVVDEGLPMLHRAKTLAHELGHAHLHLDGKGTHARAHREVEAESVAFCVMQALGFETSGYSFGYVASWSGGEPGLVTSAFAAVQRGTRAILDAVLAPATEEAG